MLMQAFQYLLELVPVIFHQIFIFHQMIALLKYEKCLFHLKSSFRSPDIQIFVFFASFPHFPNSKGQMDVE